MKTIYWLPVIGLFAAVIAIHTTPTYRWPFDLNSLTPAPAPLSLREEELDHAKFERDTEDMQRWLVFIDYITTRLASGESSLSGAADEVLPVALNRPKWVSSVRMDYAGKGLIRDNNSDRIVIARYLIAKIENMWKIAEGRSDGLQSALLSTRVKALNAEFQLLSD